MIWADRLTLFLALLFAAIFSPLLFTSLYQGKPALPMFADLGMLELKIFLPVLIGLRLLDLILFRRRR